MGAGGEARAIADEAELSQAWQRTFDELWAAQARLASQGRWVAGPSDLMAVLGLNRAEVANCSVARWLLDPLARHGLGAHMLNELGREAGFEIDDPMLVRVEVEIAIEDTRADIVLSGTRSGASVVIEAKVDAGEQPTQGARLEELWPSADRFVFLTIGGKSVPHTAADRSRWHPLSWRWLANAADLALAAVPEPIDPRSIEARASVAAWVIAARRNLT